MPTGGDARRGGNQVVARRVGRDGERSLSCPGDGRCAARRVPKGRRARCRETRRGRRMRRQGNTRQRAIPHHGAGSGYPDGYRVAHYNSPPPLPAAVAPAGRGFSIPKRAVRKEPRRTFSTARFSTLPVGETPMTECSVAVALHRLRDRSGYAHSSPGTTAGRPWEPQPLLRPSPQRTVRAKPTGMTHQTRLAPPDGVASGSLPKREPDGSRRRPDRCAIAPSIPERRHRGGGGRRGGGRGGSGAGGSERVAEGG